MYEMFKPTRTTGILHHIWDAHWRRLANTTEPSVCSGDAVLCPITSTNIVFVVN